MCYGDGLGEVVEVGFCCVLYFCVCFGVEVLNDYFLDVVEFFVEFM